MVATCSLFQNYHEYGAFNLYFHDLLPSALMILTNNALMEVMVSLEVFAGQIAAGVDTEVAALLAHDDAGSSADGPSPEGRIAEDQYAYTPNQGVQSAITT